jgi:GH15 family glucan-1,4-alpha-glucosidase
VRLEDYGLIGDLQSAALVGSNGSVDWLCLPRFDSPSCFSAPRKRGARLLDRFTGWRSTRLLPPLSPWDASRGPRRHYTYSKVMAWVVFDRAVQLAERFALDGPVERWKQIRDEIHREVCEKGYDAERRTFTQYYGSKELDASVLNIPLVGFLPGSDERVADTIDAVSSELSRDGFVSRYSTAVTDDGLSGDEGQFLACSFWLVSALAVNGRVDEARELFERVIALNNDLGLLAEEYDVKRQRQVGNFPQAFSHLTLIGAAVAIAEAGSTAAA